MIVYFEHSGVKWKFTSEETFHTLRGEYEIGGHKFTLYAYKRIQDDEYWTLECNHSGVPTEQHTAELWEHQVLTDEEGAAAKLMSLAHTLYHWIHLEEEDQC